MTLLNPPPPDYDLGYPIHRRPPPPPPEWTRPSTYASGKDIVKNICHLPDGTVIYDVLVPRTDWFGRLFGLTQYETRIGREGEM